MPANKSTGNDKTPVRVIKDSIAAISSLMLLLPTEFFLDPGN